jgi:hypothetical protein
MCVWQLEDVLTRTSCAELLQCTAESHFIDLGACLCVRRG